MFEVYLFSSTQVLIQKVEAANVKVDFGVWFLNRQKNLERFREILPVSNRTGVVPLPKSVQKRHCYSSWGHFTVDHTEEVLLI